MPAPRAAVTIRRATADDRPAILAVGRRSLGWDDGPATVALFHWKHDENPFGASPTWVAESEGRVAGFWTFLRWEFVTGDGTVRRAVRAVDTATDPGFQGQGVFTTLTLGALDELRADGVDFVFNTPNEQSRPGYLKMGWQVVGRLPVAVRPTNLQGVARLPQARTPAERGAVATRAGVAAAAALADPDLARALIASVPAGGLGVATHRTHEYLRWRYGLDALHYRVITAPGGAGAGTAVFHLRRRGPAVEAVVCEATVPTGRGGRALYRRIAEETGADYLLRLRPQGRAVPDGGFWPVPGAGPVLTGRDLRRTPPLDLAGWRLSLGDVELF